MKRPLSANRPTVLRFEALEERRLLASYDGQEYLEQDATDVVNTAALPAAASTVTPELASASPGLASEQSQALRLPAGLPASFSVAIEYAGETLTLELAKNSAFGENTRFLIDYGNGNLVQVDHGADRSYLGTVAEHPEFAVSAVLSEAGLLANIIRPHQASITIDPASAGLHRVALEEQAEEQGEAADQQPAENQNAEDQHVEERSDEEDHATTAAYVPGAVAPASTQPDALLAASTLPPNRVIEVREFEVGVEISSNALQNNYAGSTTQQKVDNAMLEAQKIPGNLDARYLHGAGIKHRLGAVIIRTDSDPFTVSNGNDSAGLAAFRDYWNSHPEEVGTTHDLAVYHVRSAPSGLAYVDSVGTSNRYALTASNGPSSWADGTLAHEFGHSWSLGHVPSGTTSSTTFYESRPRSDGDSSGGEDRFISVMHGSGTHNIGRLSTGEANKVLGVKQNKLQFGDVLTNVPEVKPFGWVDSATALLDPITIDVIANDIDANNDVLDAELRDTVSFLGGTIRLAEGTGPGGRNEIIYTPPSGATWQDFFHYTVVDSTGRTDFGAVYVNVENPVVTVDTSLDVYRYDLGTTTSPVFSNDEYTATRISNETTGDVTWSQPVLAEDRPNSGQNAFNRDFVRGFADTTLSHKIESGIWKVTLNMSDPEFGFDNMFVDAEGERKVSDIDRPIGTNNTFSFEVSVTDGFLDLTFGDDDPADKRWAVNRIVLEQLEAFVPQFLPGDYDQSEVVDGSDFLSWQRTFSDNVNPFEGADVSGNGVIDAADLGIWQDNYGETVVATSLIDATTGNGEFNLDDANDASSIGGEGEPSVDITRDRALRSLGGGNIGDGVAIPGWAVTRVSYSGGNGAIGFDGNYGFAPNAGLGVGETGQAFANSGEVKVLADTITHDFAAGDIVELSYLLGSDAAGDHTIQADVQFTFDLGLPSETTRTFDARTASGLLTSAITEQYRLSAAASTITVSFNIGASETGKRSLLDRVELSVKSPSTNSNSAAALHSPAAATAPAFEQDGVDDGASVMPFTPADHAARGVNLPANVIFLRQRLTSGMARRSTLEYAESSLAAESLRRDAVFEQAATRFERRESLEGLRERPERGESQHESADEAFAELAELLSAGGMRRVFG